MTPEDIHSAWARANATYGFDPVAGDAAAIALLHNPPGEADLIDANIAGIDRVRAEHPELFESEDYDWAFDRRVYRRALEANLQARALQMLGAARSAPNGPKDVEFGKVVLRYTFEAGTDPCSPFHAPVEGINFIVSPFAFHEFVLLLTRAFIDSAGAAGGWEGFLDWQNFPEIASPYLRQAILRSVTSDAFHSSFTGESPVDEVKRRSPWFAEARETGDIADGVETPLTCSLIDFALAHELGHVLHRHDSLTREPDLRLEREQDADVMGFALYNLSWGWRDEILDGAPLNQGPRILLGPLMFHLFIRWHVALRQGICLAHLNAGTAPGTGTLHREIHDARARTKIAFDQLAIYEAMIRQRGALFNERDALLISRVATCGSAFALAILGWASRVPEADFRIAAEAGMLPY